MTNEISKAEEEGLRLIRKHGGMIRMAEALKLGLSRWLIYKLRDHGHLERLSRGLYRITNDPELLEPDLVTVARRVPSGVICLISALSFHQLTTQVPHHVDLAIQRRQRSPAIDYPPTRFYRFSDKSFSTGVGIYNLDGVDVKIYSPEKSVADIFKYRNKLGLDIAIEALRLWRENPNPDLQELLRCAKANRVENIMRPYLEALF